MLILERRRTTAIRNPTINWTHPLSRSLKGCWLPGVTWGTDITRRLPPMTPQSAATFGGSVEGTGLKSTATASGLQRIIGTGDVLSNYTNLTLFWRGYQLGGPPSSGEFISIIFDNASSSPFVVAGIDDNGGNYHFDWNSGGTFTQFSTSTADNNVGITSLVGTYNVNGNVNGYRNGASIGSGAFGAGGGPTNSATTYITLGGNLNVTTRNSNAIVLMGAAWTRILSSQEILSLHLDPYQFIVPADTSLFPRTSGASAAVVFRRSLSSVGTRVGTRQAVI